MKRVLLIEDQADTHLLVSKAIGSTYPVTWAQTLAKGWELCLKESFELILLDVMLPDGDGFQFCAKLQNNEMTRRTPIILLTGKKGVEHRVLGFSLGADDYMEKPFDPAELRARAESKLKKHERAKEAEEFIQAGPIRLNGNSQRVSIQGSAGHEDVFLTPLEFRILTHLARNPERVFSRDQLISAVWGGGVAIVDRTIDKHISSLRQKLLHCSPCIQTVSGYGYKFNPSPVLRQAA